MSMIDKFRQFTSKPLPQRLSAQDTNDYIQPISALGPNTQYLNCWLGNQLPGQFMHIQNPYEVWVSVADRRVLYTSSPQAAQRANGSFNYNLSQETSAQIQAQWRAAWTAAASQGQ